MSSQHKLFAVGKSIAGLSGDASRYRMTKNSALPRFGNLGSDGAKTIGRFRRWWRALLGWRPWRKSNAAAVAAISNTVSDRKVGPSLNDVKVVRNDLSNSGVEVLALRRPATSKSGPVEVRTSAVHGVLPVQHPRQDDILQNS